MADFPTAVSPPSGASYMAPLLNFGWLANLPDDYYQGKFNAQKSQTNEQQQQLNTQQIQQNQQQLDLAKTFQGGLPRDRQGNIDFSRAAQMLAAKGDIGGAMTMLQQAPAPMSPLFGGAGQPGQGGGQPQPSSLPASPLPAPANSPKGDPGTGTITDIVTTRLPSQDATTGQTIARIAKVLAIDPNAPLTAGQQKRAEGLLQRYAAATPGTGADNGGATPAAGSSSGGAPGATASAPAASSFSDRFGNLPPSAAAGSPRPPATPNQTTTGAAPGATPVMRPPMPAQAQQPQPQPGPAGGPGAAVGAPMPPEQASQPQPQPQAQPQPLVPQVPLPKGFTDPQQAILALRTEAARLSANPRAKGQAIELDNWASRIEESLKPVSVNANTTLLDPRTGQPIYQGGQPTMSADAIHGAAERYLETGTLPPNIGRGAQGSANSNAIQNEAAALADQRGISMADLPKQWQQFKAQQVAVQRFQSGPQGNTVRSFNVLVDHLGTLTEAAEALKNGDIRIFNQARQAYAAQTGETAPTNFDGVKALVGDEIVKAVVGSAGALADREEVKKDLDRASSPKQLYELVERYRRLALGQLKGLRKQYEVSTGQKNFGDMLLPGTLAALGGNEGKGSAPDGDGWVTLPNGARIQEVK